MRFHISYELSESLLANMVAPSVMSMCLGWDIIHRLLSGHIFLLYIPLLFVVTLLFLENALVFLFKMSFTQLKYHFFPRLLQPLEFYNCKFNIFLY